MATMGSGHLTLKYTWIHTLITMAILMLLILLPNVHGDWPTLQSNNERNGNNQLVGSTNIAHIEKNWKFPTSHTIYSSPTCTDVNHDNKQEIFFGCDYEGVYSLDHSGEVLWNYPFDSRMGGTPSIGDINNDDEIDVVCGSDGGDGYLLALDAITGDLLWETDTAQASTGLHDLDNNSQLDVIAIRSDVEDDSGNEQYGIIAITTQRIGEIYHPVTLWEFETEYRTNEFAISDLDGNGDVNIIFGTENGIVFCINSNGEEIWQKKLQMKDQSIICSPAIFDLNSDGFKEIIVPTFCTDDDVNESYIVVLNFMGEEQWRFQTEFKNFHSPSIFDADGTIEILVGARILYSLNEFGEQNWKYDPAEPYGMAISPLIIDYNNDGKYDIIEISLHKNDSVMYGFSHQGNVMLLMPVDEYMHGSGLIASDIENDGILEVLFGSSRFNKDGLTCYKSFSNETSTPIIYQTHDDDNGFFLNENWLSIILIIALLFAFITRRFTNRPVK